MAERKAFAGDREAAFTYLSIGRNLLAQLVQSMKLNGLQVLSRSVELQNGVVITVSSTFGQNDIRIEAPPSASVQTIADIEAIADLDAQDHPFGKIKDVIKMSGNIKLTLKTRLPPPPPPPPVPPPVVNNPPPYIPPPPTDNQIHWGSDWGGEVNGVAPHPADPESYGHETDVNIYDAVRFTSSIQVTLVTATYPDNSSVIVPPPQVFICGQTTKGKTAFVWDDQNGYTPLDAGNSSQRHNPIPLGFSPDGQVIVGRIDVLQGNGYYPLAAKWQSRLNQAQVVAANSSAGTMQAAVQASNDGGTIYGTGVASPGAVQSGRLWCFKWGGNNNQSPAIEYLQSPLQQQGLTSSNGRVHVSGQSYTLDGQTVNWGPNSPVLPGGARQAPSDAVAYAVVHVPWQRPQPQQPTYTTTVLVFSA